MAQDFNLQKLFSYDIDKIDDVIQFIIDQLVKEDDLWKVLYYDDIDALDGVSLTEKEKVALVDDLSFPKDSTKFKVKLTPYNASQMADKATVELRIYDYDTQFQSQDVAIQYIAIQVIMHTTLWRLKNGKSRGSIIKRDVIHALNQERMKGVIGTLTFDNTNSRIQYLNEGFLGFTLLLHGKLG